MVETSSTALPSCRQCGKAGGRRGACHPRPHGHAQNPPSKLLTSSEKVCPTSDVFHLILKSCAKELFFLEMPPPTG